ncbi:MAG: hypothetical protein OEW00_06855 [candidate division Zixibacteria bacterium]|nr:hypothetical protein [candidate division Zixibacteria bacterium]
MKKSNLLAVSVCLALAVYYTLPFLLKITYWGVRDWDLFSAVQAAPVGSVLFYGQFPFWNPYMAGGNILFHHPEIGVLTPFFLLHLIFGVVIGFKLQVLICYFLGFWGSVKLASRLGMSMWAAFLTAVAYFGSVHFALHFAEGHMPFTHFCFLPWFVYFVLQSVEDKTGILRAGVVLALMILGNGAAIPLLYTATFAFLFCGLYAVEQRRGVYLVNLLAAAAVGVLLSAVKFLPMVIYLRQSPWYGNAGESIPLSALGVIFFGLKHALYDTHFPEQVYHWHEYAAYISPVLVLLAAAALVLRFKRYWIYLVLAAFFLLLGLGNFGALSPWALLSQLPGFSSARCTGRAFQFVILGLAFLGGFGFDLLWQKGTEKKTRYWRGVAIVAGTVVVGTNLFFAWPIMSSAFKHKPEPVHRSLVFSHVVDEKPQAYRNYLANRGSLIAPKLSAYRRSRALVDSNDVAVPEFILNGQAEVVRRDYTPNVIEYEIIGREAGRMVIGMGYDVGWRSEDGRQLSEYEGLISFAFQQGRQKIVLRYRTPYFYPGLLVTVLALAGIVWRWRRT